nr:SPOR domain-containing protein [Hyphomicrobium sp.]
LPAQGGTAVPGTALVDVFGQQQQGGGGPAPSSPPAADNTPAQAQADDAPPAKSKPVKITTINSPDGNDAAAPPKKKYKKVARAEPTVETDASSDAAPVTTHSGTGFVAVLASIPHSASSRIDALKRFADMQQKYSDALSGKTPDISSANLSKGVYDRLVVGPPGSREEANTVCAQLKAQGYRGCWVTSY